MKPFLASLLFFAALALPAPAMPALERITAHREPISERSRSPRAAAYFGVREARGRGSKPESGRGEQLEARVGTVFPLAEIPLVTQAGGRVDQIPVQEGQRVRRGQIILAIDRTRQLGEIKLLETQIAHKAALRLEELNLATAKQDLARDEALARDNTVALKAVDDSRNRVRLATERVSIERGRLEEQRQTLALKKRELEDYEVHAPADGVLSALDLHANQVVGAGSKVGEFLQLDQVLVETFVPLAEARKLAVGSRAAVRTDDGHSCSGRIRTVGQRVDPVSASVKVKVLVPNEGLRLKPGMLVRVSL